jgi:predicted nucleotidyltransferase
MPVIQMNPMIEDRHLGVVLDILKDIDGDIYVFGSRAKGTAAKYSDLDLTIDCKGARMPSRVLAKLEMAFEDSPLPYKVDIVDLNGISPNFRTAITKDFVKLPRSRG